MWGNLKNGIHLFFSFRKKYILRLKNEGLSAVIQCRFVNTVKHPRRLESSAAPFWEPQILHIKFCL